MATSSKKRGREEKEEETRRKMMEGAVERRKCTEVQVEKLSVKNSGEHFRDKWQGVFEPTSTGKFNLVAATNSVPLLLYLITEFALEGRDCVLPVAPS